MSGFGSAPAGSFAWSSIGPLVSEIAVSPGSATPASAARSRDVGLRSGDYRQDINGNILESADAVDQEVAFRLLTIAGSFYGDAEVGNAVVTVQKWTNDGEVKIRDTVRRALDPMVLRGVIRNVVVVAAPYKQSGTAVAAYSVTYDKTGIVSR